MKINDIGYKWFYFAFGVAFRKIRTGKKKWQFANQITSKENQCIWYLHCLMQECLFLIYFSGQFIDNEAQQKLTLNKKKPTLYLEYLWPKCQKHGVDYFF